MLKRLISTSSNEGQMNLPSISETSDNVKNGGGSVPSKRLSVAGSLKKMSISEESNLQKPFMAAAAQQGKQSGTTPGSSVSSNRPSLVGLFASKRIAKQLSNKMLRRRQGSLFGGSRISQVSVVQKEPTYRMEPHKKFEPTRVKDCIKYILDSKLERFPYNPKFCANMSRILSDDIKKAVKAMNFDRYKIVCSVSIGEQKGQGIHVTSRCAWDASLDSYASYTFQNDKIFCTAMVFGIYNE